MTSEDIPLMVPLSELAKRTKRSPRTVRRWLKRKGIEFEGQSGIMLSALQKHWPAAHSALIVALVGPPPCPQCGGPTRCECLVCEISVT